MERMARLGDRWFRHGCCKQVSAIMTGFLESRKRQLLGRPFPARLWRSVPEQARIFVITGRAFAGLGFEPNPYLHLSFSKKRSALHMRIELRIAGSESMDFDDASVDTRRLNGLVLCSVSDPEQCLSQIRRKLETWRKNSIFIEHVAAKAGSTLASPATFS